VLSDHLHYFASISTSAAAAGKKSRAFVQHATRKITSPGYRFSLRKCKFRFVRRRRDVSPRFHISFHSQPFSEGFQKGFPSLLRFDSRSPLPLDAARANSGEFESSITTTGRLRYLRVGVICESSIVPCVRYGADVGASGRWILIWANFTSVLKDR